MATRAEAEEPTGETLTFERQDIEEAIRDYPRQADEAMALIQADIEWPLTAETIRTFAAASHRPVESFWYEQLESLGLILRFGVAMRGAGVPVALTAEDHDDHVPFEDWTRFGASASAFRCRILVNGAVAGSGCVVGPSTVLTAWHVVAVEASGKRWRKRPPIEVLLSDGRRIDAYLPVEPGKRLEYPCTRCEYTKWELPRSDAALARRHDVALLRLKQPAALHLGAAALPDKPPRFDSRDVIYLVHYPKGQDRGIGSGSIEKIGNFTRRWAHFGTSDSGSSGGGCFSTQLKLVGIHQGRQDTRRRFVPINEFLDELRERVANDIAPRTLWSLNGQVDGQLVVGRDAFFAALAEAGQDGTAVRGIRVKRTDAAGDLSGIPFTYDLLEQVLARYPQPPFLVRVGFDAAVKDLPGEILRRASLTGLGALAEMPAPDGVASGGTDRGRRAAVLINGAAAAAGRIAWVFIEHPSVVFTEAPRYALEAFIGQSIKLPNLRLVVAGFEAVPLPGVEFQSVEAAQRSSAPGFLVDYLRGFEKADVINLLERAREDLGIDKPPGWAGGVAEAALAGLALELGRYRMADVMAVVEQVKAVLKKDLPASGRRP